MRLLRVMLLVTMSSALALALGSTQAGADTRSAAEPRIIVNPRNPATSLERRFVADAFLKKVTRWPDDELIQPVDLATDSPVRRRFSDDVLKRSVSAVKSYWQQLVFSGRGVPPPELDNEELVVRFVLHHPGAIGYVSGSVNIENARVISLR
jgi:ABC-type phosphate transport system substrate-binding protein